MVEAKDKDGWSAEGQGPLWRTPILPLPAALLFPGRRLPLHIREKESREMLERVKREDGLVSLATLRPGFDPGKRHLGRVYEVVGVGRVVRTLRYPHGLHVTFEGISRGRLLAEETVEEGRFGLVAPLVEWGGEEEVRRELASLMREVGDLGPFARRIASSSLTPGQIADLVNAHLPHPVRVRQEAFEILDVARRIRFVRNLFKKTRRAQGAHRVFF